MSVSRLQMDLNLFKPREEQVECLNYIKNIHNNNPDNKYFLLELPVGVGKSHLAMMISDWYMSEVDNKSGIDIITNSKILQNQYNKTYKSINDLRGKENYKCSRYGTNCSEGKDLCSLNKSKCNFCPYDRARENYIKGDISLTNYHLFIIFSMYTRDLLDSRKSKLLIVDEAHELEDVMTDFISVKVTEAMIKKYNINNGNILSQVLRRVNNIEQYNDFLSDLLTEIDITLRKLTSDLKVASKNVNTIQDLQMLNEKISLFKSEFKENKSNWIFESDYSEKSKTYDKSVQPIWVSSYLDKYIFSYYDKVILMSGTILSKDIFCKINGLDKDSSVYYSIPSPFPLENRKIYYMPLGKMSYTKKEETFNNFIPYINKIFNKYSTNKGLIHTNSFELSNRIQKNIKDKRLIFHDSSNKDFMLRRHFESKEPTIIVSPSMSVGVSFDDDLARFQIIAKIPYPSLASNKNKHRQSSLPEWYSWKTCASLIQSYGRIIRSREDYGDTYILDEGFSDILSYSYMYLPKWFTDSVTKIKIKK